MRVWIGRLGVMLALLAAALAVAGPSMAQADELDAILALGRVRAGICLSSGPAGSRDSDGNLRGYDVDVASLMALQLGVNLQVVETTPGSRLQMLLDDKFDVIVCTMTATPERARQVDFSLPYLRTGIKLMVPRNSPIHSLDDLKAGSRVAVERETTGEAMAIARAPAATRVYADTPGDLLLLVRQGKADAALDDGLLTDWAAKTYPDELVSLSPPYSSDAISLAIRRNNPELLRWLDLFASRFVTSGQYAASYRKWWGGDPPPIVAPW